MTPRTARLVPMSRADLAAWRSDRLAAGARFPDEDGSDRLEAHEIVVADVAVGGTVLTFARRDGRPQCSIRLLQTTIPPTAAEVWAAVIAAVEQHARSSGVATVLTTVPAPLAAPFQAAGFGTTMTGFEIVLDPGVDPLAPDDGHLVLRPMDLAERRGFIEDARAFTRAGMERSGVLSGPGAAMDQVEERLARLADDPPPEEVLLTATVDGTPVGRFWATRLDRFDEAVLVSNTLDLFPAFRGQRLTLAFLAAIERHARAAGVRRYRGLHYGHDHAARDTLLGFGATLTEVHLRKDLARV